MMAAQAEAADAMAQRRNEDTSFEARLSAARARQGLDPKPGATPAGGNIPGLLGIAWRSGVEFASAALVGTGIGLALDHWLATRPVFTLVFALLGWAAGMMNVRRTLAAMQQAAEKKE